MNRILSRFARCVSYVTCFPLSDQSQSANLSEREFLSGLSKYLPAAGLLIGLILHLLFLLMQVLETDRLLCACVLTGTWIVMTNGLHFDGLMDTADGIFSHRDRKRMIEIMADSRVGNFGAITGMLNIVFKIVCLTSISINLMPSILLVIPVWARWCETYTIGHFKYAKEEGKGKVWHDTTRWPEDVIAAAWMPIIAVITVSVLGFWPPIVISGVTVIAGVSIAHYFDSLLGGQTGDTYGAVVELSETSALLIVALFATKFTGLVSVTLGI